MQWPPDKEDEILDHQFPTMINALFTTGTFVVTLQFENMELCNQFAREMSDVKSSIAVINEEHKENHITAEERDCRYLLWLECCGRFRCRWGDSLMFPDIRWGWNSVEETMGLPVTRFTG
jgi:hypothetical protein